MNDCASCCKSLTIAEVKLDFTDSGSNKYDAMIPSELNYWLLGASAATVMTAIDAHAANPGTG